MSFVSFFSTHLHSFLFLTKEIEEINWRALSTRVIFYSLSTNLNIYTTNFLFLNSSFTGYLWPIMWLVCGHIVDNTAILRYCTISLQSWIGCVCTILCQHRIILVYDNIFSMHINYTWFPYRFMQYQGEQNYFNELVNQLWQ